MVANAPLEKALFHGGWNWARPAVILAWAASVAYFQAFFTPSLLATSGLPLESL